MTIGERLRTLRKARGLSQAEVEKRTGLMWCYVSRLENGHVTPGLQTLEKLANALEVPLYQILYEGAEARPPAGAPTGRTGEPLFGDKGKPARVLRKFVENLERMSEKDRDLLYSMAQQMANDRNERAEAGRKTKRSSRETTPADLAEPSDPSGVHGAEGTESRAEAKKAKDPEKSPRKSPRRKAIGED